MAHVAKYKLSGASQMVAHYAREAEARGYRRENIDPSRTGLNYEIRVGSGSGRGVGSRPDPSDPLSLAARVRDCVAEAIESHEAASGKAVRRDANVLADWVVTRPRDCPEEMTRSFFEAVVRFMRDRYGAENVPGGFVHMDEATPHVHVPVVPVRDGRLQASKVIDRADLRTLHADLGRAVDAALGMHVSIELAEEMRGEKQLSHLGQSEYRAAKDELGRLSTEVGRTRENLHALTEKAWEQAKREQEAFARAEDACSKASEAERRAEAAEQRAAEASQSESEALSRLGMAEVAARDAEGRLEGLQARLEGLQRDEERVAAEVDDLRREVEAREAQPARESLAQSVGVLFESRGHGGRERAASEENQQLRERVAELERECGQARGRVADLEREARELEGECRGLRAVSLDLRQRVKDAMRGMRYVSDRFGRWVGEVARELRIPVLSDFQAMCRLAQESMDRDMGDNTPRYDWGRDEGMSL